MIHIDLLGYLKIFYFWSFCIQQINFSGALWCSRCSTTSNKQNAVWLFFLCGNFSVSFLRFFVVVLLGFDFVVELGYLSGSELIYYYVFMPSANVPLLKCWKALQWLVWTQHLGNILILMSGLLLVSLLSSL